MFIFLIHKVAQGVENSTPAGGGDSPQLLQISQVLSRAVAYSGLWEFLSGTWISTLSCARQNQPFYKQIYIPFCAI